jgi:transposase-like protein
VFPKTQIQTCIVHLLRNSMEYAGWKDRNPVAVRRMIYTTNAIDALNSSVRRSVCARGHFPSDEAAMKLIWLHLREITKEWKMPAREWHAARAQFALLFGERFETYQ